MDFESFKKSFKNGRKYPASEYSDRVINLNRLEDRNYENQCRQIDRERQTVINALNREMKKVESDLETKQDLIRAMFNQQRLGLLSSFPYKFSSADEKFSYAEELQKLGLLSGKNNKYQMSSSLKLPSKVRPPMRVKKVHSAHGRLGSVMNINEIGQTKRSASAFEKYNSVEESTTEIKPILSLNRPKSGALDVSNRDAQLKLPSPVSDKDRSSSAMDLREFESSTPRFPALMPINVVQIHPKDLKLSNTGASFDSDHSTPTSTESFQIIIPSSNLDVVIPSNKNNSSPASSNSLSPFTQVIQSAMPVPVQVELIDKDNSLEYDHHVRAQSPQRLQEHDLKKSAPKDHNRANEISNQKNSNARVICNKKKLLSERESFKNSH